MPNNAMHVSRLTFFLHGILKVSLRYYPICSQNTFMRIYYQYYLILQIIPVFFFSFFTLDIFRLPEDYYSGREIVHQFS